MSSKGKHTPGPWKYCPDARGYGKRAQRIIWGAKGPGYGAIAEVSYFPSEEIEANARLIAAAPEMLAALESLEAWSQECIPDDWEDDGYEFIRQAKQAISKAKGEK